MPNQPYFDRLHDQLSKTLPLQYVIRFVDELSDHYQDACEKNGEPEQLAPESVLGAPNHLMNTTTLSYRQQSFVGRHPWISLVMTALAGPLFLTPLFVFLYVLIVIELLPHAGVELLSETDPSTLGYAVAAGLFTLVSVVPFILSSGLMYWLFQKSGVAGYGFDWG